MGTLGQASPIIIEIFGQEQQEGGTNNNKINIFIKIDE